MGVHRDLLRGLLGFWTEAADTAALLTHLLARTSENEDVDADADLAALLAEPVRPNAQCMNGRAAVHTVRLGVGLSAAAARARRARAGTTWSSTPRRSPRRAAPRRW
jgi:hypothetical protein